MPEALGGGTTPWIEGEAAAKTEHPLPLSLPIPASAPPGRYVIPIDVKHGPWQLPQFTEAIVDVVE